MTEKKLEKRIGKKDLDFPLVAPKSLISLQEELWETARQRAVDFFREKYGTVLTNEEIRGIPEVESSFVKVKGYYYIHTEGVPPFDLVHEQIYGAILKEAFSKLSREPKVKGPEWE
jgi:hypothetical protein